MKFTEITGDNSHQSLASLQVLCISLIITRHLNRNNPDGSLSPADPPVRASWIIDQSHKSHNAPAPYLTIHHSEQNCTRGHFWFEWCIVGCETGALCVL